MTGLKLVVTILVIIAAWNFWRGWRPAPSAAGVVATAFITAFAIIAIWN